MVTKLIYVSAYKTVKQLCGFTYKDLVSLMWVVDSWNFTDG